MDVDDLRLEYREVKPPLMLDFCGIDHSSPFCFGCQKTQLNFMLRSYDVWNVWTCQHLQHILQGNLWLPKSGKEADSHALGVHAFLPENTVRLTVSFPFSQHTHTHTQHTHTHTHTHHTHTHTHTHRVFSFLRSGRVSFSSVHPTQGLYLIR